MMPSHDRRCQPESTQEEKSVGADLLDAGGGRTGEHPRRGARQPLATACRRAIIEPPPQPSFPGEPDMSEHLSRRRFLHTTAAVAAASLTDALPAAQPPARADRIRLGVIGVANRGADNLAG